jgi:hypothetical protein
MGVFGERDLREGDGKGKRWFVFQSISVDGLLTDLRWQGSDQKRCTLAAYIERGYCTCLVASSGLSRWVGRYKAPVDACTE